MREAAIDNDISILANRHKALGLSLVLPIEGSNGASVMMKSEQTLPIRELVDLDLEQGSVRSGGVMQNK